MGVQRNNALLTSSLQNSRSCGRCSASEEWNNVLICSNRAGNTYSMLVAMTNLGAMVLAVKDLFLKDQILVAGCIMETLETESLYAQEILHR